MMKVRQGMGRKRMARYGERERQGMVKERTTQGERMSSSKRRPAAGLSGDASRHPQLRLEGAASASAEGTFKGT